MSLMEIFFLKLIIARKGNNLNLALLAPTKVGLGLGLKTSVLNVLVDIFAKRKGLMTSRLLIVLKGFIALKVLFYKLIR